MRHQLPLKYFDEVARTGSIRQAAEKLAITSSALNRRILALEDELEVELFERIPSGVRLSAAGEMLVQHARRHMADMDQLRSSLADLSGERRGHVTLACGQALLPQFIPAAVNRYRRQHAGVSFSLLSSGRSEAPEMLRQFTCDLAFGFETETAPDIMVLHNTPQRLHALMQHEHRLATRKSVRIADLIDHPLALPTSRNAIRIMLEAESRKRSLQLNPIVESDNFACLRTYALLEDALVFQIPLGIPANLEAQGLVAIPCDERDIPEGSVVLSQLKGRNLPVAAAKFAVSLAGELDELLGVAPAG